MRRELSDAVGLECKPAERVADGTRVLGLGLGGAMRAALEAQQRIR